MTDRMDSTDRGIRPTNWHLAIIATHLGDLRARGEPRIMLAALPGWSSELACRTEDVVGMIEYLVESGSPIIRGFGIDMHLVDSIIQCRLQREGRYDPSEWTG